MVPVSFAIDRDRELSHPGPPGGDYWPDVIASLISSTVPFLDTRENLTPPQPASW